MVKQCPVKFVTRRRRRCHLHTRFLSTIIFPCNEICIILLLLLIALYAAADEYRVFETVRWDSGQAEPKARSRAHLTAWNKIGVPSMPINIKM